jgi:hypothetical protein
LRWNASELLVRSSDILIRDAFRLFAKRKVVRIHEVKKHLGVSSKLHDTIWYKLPRVVFNIPKGCKTTWNTC